MPTYGYRCDKGHEFEVFQGMTEAPLEVCQECGAPVRRIFYPVGIVFKGPGFYKTDSRGSSSSTNPAPPAETSAGTDKADATAKEPKKSEKKSDPKPAVSKESKPASSGSEKKPA